MQPQVASNRSLQNPRAWLRRGSHSGSFSIRSERPLTDQLTQNAASIPPGVFSFPAVFRAVYDIRRHAADVSVSRPSLSGCGRDRSSGRDWGQNSLTLWLARVAESWSHQGMTNCDPLIQHIGTHFHFSRFPCPGCTTVTGTPTVVARRLQQSPQ